MQKTLIIDKDHIRELYKKSPLEGVTQSKVIEQLFGTKNITTYLLGAAGVGKSTVAEKTQGGIYANNLNNMISHVEQDKPTIVINSNKPDVNIAQHAQKIYIIEAPESRITTQKIHRGETNSFTNFGRNEKATLGAPTDNIFNKAILNRDHPNKTFIYQLTGEPFSNDHEVISLSRYIKIPDISLITMGQTAGKFSPPHLGHTGMIELFLKEYNILNIIIGGALDKHGFHKHEIQKILNKIFTNNELIFDNLTQYGGEYFININGIIQQVNLARSGIILGKDRLPEGFERGSIDDPQLVNFQANNSYQITMPLNNAKMFGTIVRAPDVKILDNNGLDMYISSSAYRERIFDPKSYSTTQVQSWFHPEIAGLLTQSDNVEIIKQRLINGQWLTETIKKTSEQIKDNHKKTYSAKWGEDDFYTVDGREKSFDGRIPKGDYKSKKKSFIEEMQGTIKTQLDEIKQAHKAKDIGQLIGIDY